MRIMKKVMTGMSVAALAMVAACGISANADAKATATFTANAQTMTVSGEANEVLVSFDAIKADKKGALTWNAKAKWDLYDGTTTTVDLSALKTAKDMYIAVKDDQQTEVPTVYHIAPDTTKFSGKYEVADKASKLTFKNGKEAFTVANANVLEYRTEKANGWTKYNPTTFSMAVYEEQGATLYFRKQAANMTAVDAEEATDNYLLSEVSGNFASKEFKVKVTKKANAPTATIDYDKGLFKVKKGTEYRRIVSGSFVAPTDGDAGDWTPADSTTTVSEVPVDVATKGIFEVRTAADKKVASKVSVYAYAAVATPKAGDIANGVSDTVASKASGLNLTYGKDKYGKDQVTFNNTNKNASYIIYSQDPATTAKPKVVATLKKAEEKGYKDVVVAQAKLADASEVWVVTASEKKNGVFRSKAYKFTIAYPAADDTVE